jgi:hypothetical protein
MVPKQSSQPTSITDRKKTYASAAMTLLLTSVIKVSFTRAPSFATLVLEGVESRQPFYILKRGKCLNNEN